MIVISCFVISSRLIYSEWASEQMSYHAGRQCVCRTRPLFIVELPEGRGGSGFYRTASELKPDIPPSKETDFGMFLWLKGPLDPGATRERLQRVTAASWLNRVSDLGLFFLSCVLVFP